MLELREAQRRRVVDRELIGHTAGERLGAALEEDHIGPVALGADVEWAHVHAHRGLIGLHLDAFVQDLAVFLGHASECRTQRCAERPRQELEDLEGGPSRRHLEQRGHITKRVQQLILGVEHHAAQLEHIGEFLEHPLQQAVFGRGAHRRATRGQHRLLGGRARRERLHERTTRPRGQRLGQRVPARLQRLIELPLLVDDIEERGQRADRFARAEEEVAARPQRIRQQRDHATLQVGAQINEHVATGHEVHARERRVLEEIVAGEDHAIAQRTTHLVAIAVGDEPAREPLRRHVGGNGVAVSAGRRELHGVLIHVGREDPHVAAQLLPFEFLENEDDDGIRLFPCGAGRHPHTELAVGGRIGHELRYDALLE